MAQLVNSELDGGEIQAGRIATIQNPSDNRSSIYKLSSPCVKRFEYYLFKNDCYFRLLGFHKFFIPLRAPL